MKAWITGIAILIAAAGCTTTKTEQFSTVRFDENNDSSVLDARLRQLEKLSKEYPKKSEYPYQMAGVFRQKGDLRGAAKALERAIAIDPHETQYHFHLGRLYLEMKELEPAEKAFRKAIDLMPSGRYTGPHGALGYVLCLKGSWDEALAEYRACAALDPSDPIPFYYMGCIHDRKGERDDAVRNLSEYLQRGGTLFRSASIGMLESYGVMPPEAPATLISDGSPRGPGDRQAATDARRVFETEGPMPSIPGGPASQDR
jgi:tetratricopeptide (TPR) repeat protein